MESRIARQEYLDKIEGRISRREFFQVGLLLTLAASTVGSSAGVYDVFVNTPSQSDEITKKYPAINPTIVYDAQKTVIAGSNEKGEIPPQPAVATAVTLLRQNEINLQEGTKAMQESGLTSRLFKDTLLVSLMLPAFFSYIGLKNLLETKKRLQEVRDELNNPQVDKLVGGRQVTKNYFTSEEINQFEKRINNQTT